MPILPYVIRFDRGLRHLPQTESFRDVTRAPLRTRSGCRSSWTEQGVVPDPHGGDLVHNRVPAILITGLGCNRRNGEADDGPIEVENEKADHDRIACGHRVAVFGSGPVLGVQRVDLFVDERARYNGRDTALHSRDRTVVRGHSRQARFRRLRDVRGAEWPLGAHRRPQLYRPRDNPRNTGSHHLGCRGGYRADDPDGLRRLCGDRPARPEARGGRRPALLQPRSRYAHHRQHRAGWQELRHLGQLGRSDHRGQCARAAFGPLVRPGICRCGRLRHRGRVRTQLAGLRGRRLCHQPDLGGGVRLPTPVVRKGTRQPDAGDGPVGPAHRPDRPDSEDRCRAQDVWPRP